MTTATMEPSPRILHSDISEAIDQSLPACGMPPVVGLSYVHHESFHAYQCAENETKCAECAQLPSGLSATERAYIALDRRKAEVKKFFDDLNAATEALIAAHGVGHFFQDADGVVYKTAVPEGKFVYFEKYTVNRTRRLSEGEKSGSLSITEARAAGYEVEGR